MPSGPPAEQLREEAFAAVRQLMADFPASPAPISAMATLHYAFKDPDEAEKWWHRALEIDPKRVGDYTVLAKAAMGRGDFDKAAALWRKAQEVSPSMPGVYVGYADMLLTTGKPDEAIAALEKEIKLSPDSAQCSALLGKAYLQRREYERAAESYQQALEAGSADRAVLYGLSIAYARLGQEEKAREYMEKFQARRGQERAQGEREGYIDQVLATVVLSRTLTDVGRAYAEHGNLRKAEECWLRAAAADPKSIPCRQSLVELYRSTGRLRQAVTTCEQLRALVPRSAANELGMGVMLAKLQQFDAAETAARNAIDLAPRRPAGYGFLAELLLLRNRNLPEARALAERLVALEPSGRNYELLGRARDRSGDLSGARAALERALQLEPDSEMIRGAFQALRERK
jgi:tetratricopeptide (TPR) repeat protein